MGIAGPLRGVVWKRDAADRGRPGSAAYVSILNVAVLKSVQTRIHHFDAGFFGQAATQTRATTRVAPTAHRVGCDLKLGLT